MENRIEYVYSCSNAFFTYLNKGEDLDLLIKDLNRIQTHADENIGGEDCTLWFKFGSDDTLATDIYDIQNDLTSYVNRNLILSKMERVIGIAVDDELRVFYS
jgi:hypothetical protein